MKVFAFVSVLLVSSATAFAADLAPTPPESIAPAYVPYSWTGFYVGAQAGYAWADTKGSVSQTVPFVPGAFLSSGHPDGGFGGGFAGYNYQFPQNFVVGLEADIDGGDIKSTDPARFPGVGRIPIVAQSKMDWFGSARLRVGYAVDRFLPYLTGGYAFGNVKTDYVNPTTNENSLGATDVMSGWTVGAGLEYAITDNILARVEYRYTDYGSKASPTHNAGGIASVDRDFKTNDVRVGVSYKF